MEIKAAIFDMDGTLIDSLGFWEMFWKKVGKEYLGKENFRPKTEDDRAIRTMTLFGAMERIHKNYNIAQSAEELHLYCRKVLCDFYGEEVTIKAGVLEFLDYLKAQGTRMCIASATATELLQIVIDRFELNKYFECVLSCDTYGVGKDKPDIYFAAAQKLGAEVDETCVFEDSLVAVKTAAAIGMTTVGIFDKHNYGQEQIKATATYYIAENETLEKLM